MTETGFMRRAIALSLLSLADGGGPFGSVVVKNGKMVGEGMNRVIPWHDPTAHGEIVAIRNACSRLGTSDLSGCTLYTSGEPCPMCLAAIYWAHIDAVYYGNTKEDAANIGFIDAEVYDELALPLLRRRIPMHRCCEEEAIVAFRKWEEEPGRQKY